MTNNVLPGKALSKEDVKIVELVSLASMGDKDEVKAAVIQLLKRGYDIKAGYEVANRLIEVLESKKGAIPKHNGQTLYSSRGNPKHDSIRDDFKILINDGVSKNKSYNLLAKKHFKSPGYVKTLCKGINKS